MSKKRVQHSSARTRLEPHIPHEKWKTLHSCTTYSADGGASALIMGATAASRTRSIDAVAPRVRCMGEFMATDYPGVCSVIRMDR
jgi:hypothetical protein